MLSRLTFFVLVLMVPSGFVRATAPPVSERIRAAAEAVLAERFPGEAHRLRVRVIRTGGQLTGEADLKVTFQSSDALPRAHAKVDVWRQANDGWTKAGWALLYVAHFDSVVVAREGVAQGAVVTPEQVTFAWMDVTGFRGEPLRPAVYRALARDEVFAARPLRERRPLRAGDLRPPFAANTGDAVLMHYRRGKITLRMACKAREPGFIGDVIRLYNPDTDTMYRARLTAPGAAEWMETR
ncbi:flagellar basal body P-ring formation chaperone FlgA [Rhodocaloribacter sp.]